jgi:hypothetical protein
VCPALRYGVLGGLVAVLADGGIDEVVVVSVVVVVVPVVPAESVVVVLVDDSSLVVWQAANDIVATAKAARVSVRSMAFIVSVLSVCLLRGTGRSP